AGRRDRPGACNRAAAGEGPGHVLVPDARVEVALAAHGGVPEGGVEAHRGLLGAEHDLDGRRLAGRVPLEREGLDRPHEERADATPTVLGEHGQPAEVHVPGPVEEEPSRPAEGPVVVDGEDVARRRRLVEVVDLDLGRDALLVDEDGEAHRPRRLEVGAGGDDPRADAHRAPSRIASSAAARSAGYSLVTTTGRPSRGWANPSRTAWSHWRVSPRRRARTGSAP